MAPRLTMAHAIRIMRSTAVLYPLADGRLGQVEKCGLLRGRNGVVRWVEETRNVSPSPLDSFEIDPAALFAAHRRSRRPHRLDLLGYWHTHPSGDAFPSPRDAEGAAPDGRLWLIATLTEATLWRAVEGGAVHGRFDPVRFDLLVGSRVEKDVVRVQQPG